MKGGADIKMTREALVVDRVGDHVKLKMQRLNKKPTSNSPYLCIFFKIDVFEI